MSRDQRKVCFVVMGFGKKTDFESGRTLDLDATYEAIIAPAANEEGLRCIRADEIMHSGVIDTEMYEMLLRADLVIADISTGNPNAVYELGVRHALRPNSTIIMNESGGRLHFDLNHVNTLRYKHLGDDIGVREAARAKRVLRELIVAAVDAQKPDSPVYTYLPRLRQPSLSEEEYADLLDEAEAAQKRLAAHIKAGDMATRESRHADAVDAFTTAAKMAPGDASIIQRLTLATYKSEKPSKFAALIEGLQIIRQLNPEDSNDPETLGIAGAIHKRLWLMTGDRAQLDAAIRLYGRGFEVRRDYYNGENLALCYRLRSNEQQDSAEAQFDRMSAAKVSKSLSDTLTQVVQSAEFDQRSDRRWVFATLANSLYAIGAPDEASQYEKAFFAEQPAAWEIQTYQDNKKALSAGNT